MSAKSASKKAAKPVPVTRQDVKTANFDYDYSGLDLKPGSKQSEAICTYCLNLFNAAQGARSQYEPDWRDIDRAVDCYMPADQYDRAIKATDSRKQTTIVVPLTYAMHDLKRTYMGRVFFNDERIVRIRGEGGKEEIIAGSLLEKDMLKQAEWFNWHRNLDIIISNADKYGRATGLLKWQTQRGARASNILPNPIESAMAQMAGIDVQPGRSIPILENDAVLYSGIDIVPLDPWHTWYDPDGIPSRPNEDGFLIWSAREDINALLREELNDMAQAKEREESPDIVNTKYVNILAQNGKGQNSMYFRSTDGRGNVGDKTNVGISTNTRKVDSIYFMIDVIPKYFPSEELRVGDGEYPEKWFVQISADRIVRRCKRMNYRHGKFPRVDMTLTDEGHSPYPISDLKRISPYQFAASWLLRSKLIADTTMMNGRVLYNTNFISGDALRYSEQGMAIPVDPGYDGDLSQLYHQIQFDNPTQEFMSLISIMSGMAREDMGLGPAVGGDLSDSPERPGVNGIQAMQAGQFSRLKRQAFLIDSDCFGMLAELGAYMTQQFRTEKQWISITGHMAEMLARELGADVNGRHPVYPEDIQVPFSISRRSALRTHENELDAMSEVMRVIMQSPQFPQEFAARYGSGLGIFEAWCRLRGFQDLAEYAMASTNKPPTQMNVAIAPAAPVMAEADKGNLVPMGVMPSGR